MTFSQGPGFSTPNSNDPQAFITANILRKRLGLPPLIEQSAESREAALARARDPLGALSLAERGLLQSSSQSQLPPLPQIPLLTKAPSRLSTRQIAGAARSLRVAASKRKGRASTILGGSIGADPERKTLLTTQRPSASTTPGGLTGTAPKRKTLLGV